MCRSLISLTFEHRNMADTAPASQGLATALMGPFFIGWSVNQILWGILVALFTSYTGTELYRRDSRVTKISLWLIILLSTSDAAISMEETFHFGVDQHRDAETFFAGTFTAAFQPLVTGITALFVQGLLTRRAAKLLPEGHVRTTFYTVMGLAIALAFAGSCMVASLAWAFFLGKTLPINYSVANGIWLWTSACCDVLISASLWWTLKKHIAGFNSSTDSTLRSLIGVALRTALYTSILSVIGAALSVSFSPSDLNTIDVSSAFWLPLGPLHALSFFTTLSSRGSMQLASTRFTPPSVGGHTPGLPIELRTTGVVVNQVEFTKVEDSNGEIKFPRLTQTPPNYNHYV